MGRNDFIAQQRATQKAFFDEGVKMGRQQMLDMLSLVLRNPDIVGKDIFGKDRLLKVVQGIDQCIGEYNLAWQRHDEADYWQKKLDNALAEAYGEELHDTFFERYECIPEFDYTKGKWKK